MDKKTFNKQAIANPDSQVTDFLQQINDSEESHAFVEQQKQVNSEIKSVLLVDVPEGLAGRILLNQTLSEQGYPQKFFKNAYLVAASVLLAAVIFLQLVTPMPSLSEAVLTHVHDELDHLVEQRDVSDGEIKKLVQSFGGKLVGSIGQVNYAGKCNIRKSAGIHFVLQGSEGPVTVFVMPKELIKARQRVSDERFNGVILPAANGSVAIIGENESSVSQIESRVLDAITWAG